MSPIPGDPHQERRPEFKTKDGRKVKLKVPGLDPRPKDARTEERGSEEPPRGDPRPPIDPNHIGGL
jgi:hypothetical protein